MSNFARSSPGDRGRLNWRTVLTGAVWGFVALWLIAVVICALFLIGQRYHPILFVTSFVFVPTLALVGAVLGALGGVIVARLGAHQLVANGGHPRTMQQLFARAATFTAAGTGLVVLFTYAWAVIEYRPIAKLETLGGRVDYRSGLVSFPNAKLTDDQLPAVIESLNRAKYWYLLNLAATDVSSDGLKHLRDIAADNYYLMVSIDQLDNDGLRHLGILTNIYGLHVVGKNVAPATRDKVKQKLPNVTDVFFDEELDF